MIANWLPNNVPKLSTILYSAGMMVPWLLPNRAVGHELWIERSYSLTNVPCQYDSPEGLMNAVLRVANKRCEDEDGYRVGNPDGTFYRRKQSSGFYCYGFRDGTVNCDVPLIHEHDPYPSNLASADCDCGNCEEDGCDS